MKVKMCILKTLKISFSRNTWPISTKLGTKPTAITMKGTLNRDNTCSENTLKTHKNIYRSPCIFQPNLTQIILVEVQSLHIEILVVTLEIFGGNQSVGKMIFLYPTQLVADGLMFLTRPSVNLSVSQSVSQSVSLVFLVSATPLKPFNRIS